MIQNKKGFYFLDKREFVQNVKKRLTLLYPGLYELEISNEGDFFVVSLILQLKLVTENKIITEKINPVTETFASNDTALSLS